MKTLEELEAEIVRLKAVIKQVCDEFNRILIDEPDDNGIYPHLGICSGNRRHPIGRAGCVCKSAPIFKRAQNPHNYQFMEHVRPPQLNGDGWDKFKCLKCDGTTDIFVDEGDPPQDLEELNRFGWCLVFKDEKTS